MMEKETAKLQKRKELIDCFSFTDEQLSEAEQFFSTKEINFKHKENPTFTFIDLFAGIGGFRIAMQENGGKCVFSSEWDDAAKQTYYENYGEVPFGDITKESTKALIPEHFDVLCVRDFLASRLAIQDKNWALRIKQKELYFLIFVKL